MISPTIRRKSRPLQPKPKAWETRAGVLATKPTEGQSLLPFSGDAAVRNDR
jgi:hypothetical protein